MWCDVFSGDTIEIFDSDDDVIETSTPSAVACGSGGCGAEEKVMLPHSSFQKDDNTTDKEDDEGSEDTSNNHCEVCGGGRGELVCCDFCECAYHDIKCLNVKADELFDPWACPKCAGNLTQVMDDYKLRKRKRKRTEKKARRLMIEEGSHVAEATTAAKSRVATPTHHDTHTLSARGTNKKRACLEESDDEPREHACAVEQPVLVACTAKGADAKQQQVKCPVVLSLYVLPSPPPPLHAHTPSAFRSHTNTRIHSLCIINAFGDAPLRHARIHFLTTYVARTL